MNLFNQSRVFEHVHVEMSNKCNLACPMCPRIDLLQRGMINNKEDMSLKNFITIEI